jgi:hypothetical protein
MRGAARSCHVEIEADFEKQFRAASSPHILLADRLVRAIQALDGRRAEFDVLFVYTPLRWEAGFAGRLDEDFDLHDHIKGATAIFDCELAMLRQ